MFAPNCFALLRGVPSTRLSFLPPRGCSRPFPAIGLPERHHRHHREQSTSACRRVLMPDLGLHLHRWEQRQRISEVLRRRAQNTRIRPSIIPSSRFASYRLDSYWKSHELPTLIRQTCRSMRSAPDIEGQAGSMDIEVATRCSPSARGIL